MCENSSSSEVMKNQKRNITSSRPCDVEITMFAEQIETQRNADSNNERPTMNDNQVRLEGKRKRMKVKEG